MEEDEEKDTGDFTESYDGDQDVIGQFQGDGAGLPQQVEAVPVSTNEAAYCIHDSFK